MTEYTTKTFDDIWEGDAWNLFSELGNGSEIVILGEQNHKICLGFNKFETAPFFAPKRTAIEALIKKNVIKNIDLDNVTMDDNVTLEITQKGRNLFTNLKNKENAIELFVKTLGLKRP